MNSLKLVTCGVNVLGSAGVGVAFTSVEKHQIFLGSENKARCYTVFIHFIRDASCLPLAFWLRAAYSNWPASLGLRL